jgi:hypothetical protein
LRVGSIRHTGSGEHPPAAGVGQQDCHRQAQGNNRHHATDECVALTASPMIRLSSALNAWGTPEFNDILVQEIEQLTIDQLPLQQGLSTGSHALDNKLRAMIISIADEENCIRARAGIFYTGVIAGCSCADDPTPVNEENEYCEVQLEIDKTTAGTTVVLLAE